jgi:hypothetical protein
MDPRYRRLYDFAGWSEPRARELFDLFMHGSKNVARELSGWDFRTESGRLSDAWSSQCRKTGPNAFSME